MFNRKILMPSLAMALTLSFAACEPEGPNPDDARIAAIASSVPIGATRAQVIGAYGQPFHKKLGDDPSIYCELYDAGEGPKGGGYSLEVLYRNNIVIQRRGQYDFGVIHCDPFESAFVDEN